MGPLVVGELVGNRVVGMLEGKLVGVNVGEVVVGFMDGD